MTPCVVKATMLGVSSSPRLFGITYCRALAHPGVMVCIIAGKNDDDLGLPVSINSYDGVRGPQIDADRTWRWMGQVVPE